jgi:AcrR family transcriptional regulator
MNPSQTTGRGTLSRERVVAAACELVEREGLAALNMRRVAEEFGVTPMSLYRYVRDKEELVDAVLDALIDRRPVPDARGPWRRRVIELMSWLRQELERYPDVLALRLHRPLLSPGALTLTERVMRALTEGGFASVAAARAYRALFAYTFGYAAYGPRQQGSADQAKTLATLLTLPAEEYPVLREAARAAAVSMAEEQFEFGLDALLDGLVARLTS